MNGRAGLLLLSLSLSACAPEEPPPAAPPAVPRAEPPVPPPLPDLAPVDFRPWEEIDPESHLEIPAPADAGALRWTFREGRRFGYAYAETLGQSIRRTLGERVEEHRSREKNRGTFEFVGGKDGTALFRVKIQTSELYVDDETVPRPPHDENPASASEALVEADGTPDLKKAGGRADARYFLLTLLALQPGERPLLNGTVRTRAAGAHKVERWDCVRLESEFEARVEEARERQVFKGRAVGYFCPAEGRFIRAAGVVSTTNRKLELTKDGAAWVVTSLDAVSRTSVRLLE